MNKTAHSLEPLEARIAPSTLVLVSAQTAKYTDTDGDHVTVHFSKPILTQSNLTSILQTIPGGAGEGLNEINLNGISGAAGTDISVTAQAVPGGDGLANVRLVDAGSLDLGTVKIQGNLSEFFAGSGGASNVAVRSLDVQTLGLFRSATDGFGGIEVDGQLGALKVAGDLDLIPISVFDNASPGNAKIGSFFIGGTALDTQITASGGAGSVHIGAINDSTFAAAGDIGAVTVVKGIVFDLNTTGPAIQSTDGGIASLTISGNSSLLAKVLAKRDIGPVKLAGTFAGSIESTDGSIGSVAVHGGLPGQIESQVDLGAVKISGDLTGLLIAATGKIASVTIGDSIVDGGLDGLTLGPIKIAHDLNSTRDGGFLIEGGTVDSLTVGGSAYQSFADAELLSVSSTLGPVRIGHDLTNATIKMPESGAKSISITIGGSMLDNSTITTDGDLGAVHIGGALNGKILAATGAIASVRVGGTVGNASSIEADTSLGPVTIGQNLADGSSIHTLAGGIGTVGIGGSITGQATIEAHTDLASLAVAANVDMAGQNGEKTIFTDTGDIGPITIGGIITGDATIDAHRNLESITVHGDVGLGSVIIAETGAIDALAIGGSLRQGSLIQSQGTITSASIGGDLSDSQLAVVDGDLTTLKIHGALIADELPTSISAVGISVLGSLGSLTLSGGASGAFDANGPTIVGGNLGVLKIGGSVTNLTITASTNIQSVSIAGNMTDSSILTQPTAGLNQVIGTISVTGNFVDSNIVAGIKGSAGEFGASGDKLISASSTISRITIGGTADGSIGNLGLPTAIEAQELTSITVHGKALALTPGPSNDDFLLPSSGPGAAGIVVVREL